MIKKTHACLPPAAARFHGSAVERLLTADVVLEVLDLLFLICNDCLNQVPDRYHRNDAVVFDDWKVANSHLGHHGHTFVYGLVARRRRHVSSHDLGNLRAFG